MSRIVYFGTVRRGDLNDIFGKAIATRAKIFFAWGKSGWLDGAYQHSVIAYWGDEGTIWAGLAFRNGSEGLWNVQLGNSRNSAGINLGAEQARLPGVVEKLLMPVEVANALFHALERMKKYIAVPEDSEETPNRGTLRYGTQTPRISKN